MKLVRNRCDKEIKDTVHIFEQMRTKVMQGGKLSNKEAILLTKNGNIHFLSNLS